MMPLLDTLDTFDRRFATEEDCERYLFEQRWPDGVRCARCGNPKVFAVKSRPGHWVCKAKDCGGRNGYRFSLKTGTIFQDTKYPLKTWFKVGYLMLTSKKGISAHQIFRIMKRVPGSDYHTFWFMCHRLRAAMKNAEWLLAGKLIEIDEAYFGGKKANRHWSERKEIGGRGTVGKTAVLGAIARKGNVVAQVVSDTTTATTNKFVRQMVADNVSLIATDEGAAYKRLDGLNLPHDTVDHKAGEYVRGEVHTNNIENFWSLLKRGVVGTFHKVSATYLPL